MALTAPPTIFGSPIYATPTLMVWGEHDTALGIELTVGYEDLVDDFALMRLPQASHWVQRDLQKAVNAALASWLKDKRAGFALRSVSSRSSAAAVRLGPGCHPPDGSV